MPEGMTATPAAPTAPAASAPAPVATPAVSTTSVMPAVTTPAVEAPVTPSVTVEAPAVASTPAAKPEPKQTDFPDDVEGFLIAHTAWEREGGEAPADETKPALAETMEPVAETKVEEQTQAEPEVKQPEPAVTPEALNALITKSPELKAVLEASPEVKNALFSMARINAKAAPILEILPTVDAAKFAADTSNKFVSIRGGFMDSIENPESLPDAYAQFADEFAQKDAAGKAVLDPQGNPVYDQDFHMLNDFIVDTYHGIEIDDLEAQAKAGTLPEGDELALQAFKYIKEWKSGKTDGPAKPNLEGLSPEAKAYFEQRERDLAEREAKIGGNEKKQTAEQRKAERDTYNTNVERKVGSSVGKRLQQMVADDEKAGVFIPSYVTQAKDPETGISVFAKNMLDQFEEKTYGRTDRKTGKVIGGVAHIRNTMRMLSQRPPSPEAEKARVDYALQLVDEFLPTIYEGERRKVQTQAIEDRKREQGNSQARERLTVKEPQGGNAPVPRQLDPQTAMNEAYKWVDQNFPDIDRAERTSKALIKKDELLGGRR